MLRIPQNVVVLRGQMDWRGAHFARLKIIQIMREIAPPKVRFQRKCTNPEFPCFLREIAPKSRVTKESQKSTFPVKNRGIPPRKPAEFMHFLKGDGQGRKLPKSHAPDPAKRSGFEGADGLARRAFCTPQNHLNYAGNRTAESAISTEIHQNLKSLVSCGKSHQNARATKDS